MIFRAGIPRFLPSIRRGIFSADVGPPPLRVSLGRDDGGMVLLRIWFFRVFRELVAEGHLIR